VSRRRDERGNAVVEFSWLAILLLLPLLYIMLTVFDVQRTAYGATAATHAAGRAFMLVQDGEGEDVARARAFEAARVAMLDQGVELDPSELEISCDPACLEPDSTVTVRLRTQVPLPLVPDLLADHGPSVRVDAAHTETYCQFCEAR
jgi:Flp pilus assembly protein TadG